MVTKVQLFEWLQRYSCLNLTYTVRPSVFSDVLDFLFVGLDDLRLGHNKFGYTVRIAHSNFGYCCRIKKREDQLRRSTLTLRSQVAKRIEVEGGILEYFLQAVTIFVFQQ
jgi:hypothetical protein